MVATSTAINACDAVIHLANHLGVTFDISGSANELTLDLNNEIGDYKIFGSRARLRLVCGKDASLSLKIWYTRGGNEALDLLKRWYFTYGKQARFLKFYLPDESVGSDAYDGYYVLESMSIPVSSEEAGPIAVDVNLLPSGDVNWSVQAT